MTIDLKNEWGDADLAALLGSVEDDRDWRMEVDQNGIVGLFDKTNDPTDAAYDESLHCYFEIWHQGTDYVGAGAAADKQLVGSIAKALRKNYPSLEQGRFIFI